MVLFYGYKFLKMCVQGKCVPFYSYGCIKCLSRNALLRYDSL